MKITEEIAEILKSYVYVYIDPQNGEPFYIGKGKGNRLFENLDDKSDNEKVTRISKIRQNGKEPIIDILRYGLSDSEAALVEASAIDLIGLDKLANRIRGFHQPSYGRINSQEVVLMLRAKPVDVHIKTILITINKLYHSKMTPLELYEATRGTWVVGARRNLAEYAMAVYQGIVREVYIIDKWHPAGTLEYQTRDSSTLKKIGRWEFSGSVAYDIHDEYIGFSVGKGGRNPIRYVNV